MPEGNTAGTHSRPSTAGSAMHELLLSVRRFVLDESGHTLVEYLFMLSLMIFAALIGIGIVGDTALDLFTQTKNAMP